MEKFGIRSATEYLQQANESLVTVVQIETKEALENVWLELLTMAFERCTNTPGSYEINEIAQVPGVDVLFAGPFDLGNNIGHPITDGTMHENLKEAVGKIQQVAKQHNKRSGIYATSGEQARQFADQGFQMVGQLILINVFDIIDRRSRYP